MHQFGPLDGALLIDKPAGPTSHDVVDAIRRRFQIKKAGHCGTLDPKKLMSADKVYEGAIRLGETTASYDADGELTASLPVPSFTLEQLNQTSAAFVGDQMQLPPMVSAVKKDGVPLYKLARQGLEVERRERLIHIYSFQFTSYQEPIGCFRVACTKGTYVRTLAHDFGRKLGCGAHLAALRRTASGRFDVAEALLNVVFVRRHRRTSRGGWGLKDSYPKGSGPLP